MSDNRPYLVSVHNVDTLWTDYLKKCIFVAFRRENACVRHKVTDFMDGHYLMNRGNNMEFMTVRELSKSPKDTLTRLSKDGKAVLTNNGKPQALIFRIDEENFECTLALLQKLEFMQNLTEIRLVSIQNGNANMTMDEINAEIAAARKRPKNN